MTSHVNAVSVRVEELVEKPHDGNSRNSFNSCFCRNKGDEEGRKSKFREEGRLVAFGSPLPVAFAIPLEGGTIQAGAEVR